MVCVFSTLLIAPPADGREVIPVDEVVASVGVYPILESDLTLARLVHLIPGGAGRSAILEARVRLEVQYRDLEASGVLYRLDMDHRAVLEDLVRRAGGAESLREALAAHGLTMEDVNELASRITAVNAYVRQRLRPRVRVLPEELEKAYEETLALEITAQGGTPPPLDEVREQLHTILVERKLNQEIARWIREAERRQEITILVPDARED